VVLIFLPLAFGGMVGICEFVFVLLGFQIAIRVMSVDKIWSKAVLYEMNVRQLTPEGTFEAATKHLPFLRDLGVDAVWVMPPYPIGREGRKGSLGSYYSVQDYCAINPEFGTAEQFDAFVAEVHRLGMKVLLDWVANHTARDAKWLREKPYDWYERDAQGVAVVPWDWSDTAKLNYANREVWQGQIDAMLYWITEHNIDGFRCDMAMLVPIEFWQEVSVALRRVKPDVFMLAEAEELNLFDRAFDACYAWEMHHLLCDIAQGKLRVDALRNYIYADRERYPQSALRMMFTSNHDENSWSGSEFSRLGDSVKIMAALTFVLPQGLPLIYTGQEVGYDHSFEFFDRDALPSLAPNEWSDFYRKLASLKHRCEALESGDEGGSFVEIRNNAEDCLMTFVREKCDSCVVCIMNVSPWSIHTDYNTGIYAGGYRDVMTGESVVLANHIERDMLPWEFVILERV
jgi:glycosidase